MFTALQEIHWLALPAAIFLARICDVSVGTVRIICVTRGFRVVAVILAFVEIIIWVSALSAVFAHLNRIENMLAYAGGFATGNAVGMWLEQKVALGTQIVGLVSKGLSHAVAERLRFAGFRVTTLNGDDRDGPVAVCMAVVPRRKVQRVIAMARGIDQHVLATVADVREWGRPLVAGQWPGKLPAITLPLGSRRVATATSAYAALPIDTD